MYLRRQFLEKIRATSPIPAMFEVSSSKDVYLMDHKGKAYLDLSSGFSVNNIGHSNEKVLQAIRDQIQKYMHTTVYGEHIQNPQILLAESILNLLPEKLNQLFFLTAGTEVIDAAIKLSRKFTSRSEIVVCRKAYHGSSLAAESLRSDMEHSQKFRPLIPGIKFIEFNKLDDIEKIDKSTAAVIMEVVQTEAGIITADRNFLEAIDQRCKMMQALLIFDEIQTGFGRTGSLFAFQKTRVIPDILLAGKALGGGLPLSALISSKHIIKCLSEEPSLGHLSTFGGHPVSCAAGLASLSFLLAENLMEKSVDIANKLSNVLNAKGIRFRNSGLFFAIDIGKLDILKLIYALYEENILAESFLFNSTALRFAPPLIIEEDVALNALNQIIRLISS